MARPGSARVGFFDLSRKSSLPARPGSAGVGFFDLSRKWLRRGTARQCGRRIFQIAKIGAPSVAFAASVHRAAALPHADATLAHIDQASAHIHPHPRPFPHIHVALPHVGADSRDFDAYGEQLKPKRITGTISTLTFRFFEGGKLSSDGHRHSITEAI